MYYLLYYQVDVNIYQIRYPVWSTKTLFFLVTDTNSDAAAGINALLCGWMPKSAINLKCESEQVDGLNYLQIIGFS